MQFLQVHSNGREEEILSNSRDFTEQIPTKQFLSLFSSALHPPPSFVNCFSTAHRWKRNTTKMTLANTSGTDLPGGHRSTLAPLCVANMLQIMTQRWPYGHTHPLLLAWQNPGLRITHLLHHFGEVTRQDLSRINYSSSEISTEEKLDLRADTDCFSLWILIPLLCLLSRYFTSQYLPSECGLPWRFLFYCSCLEIEEDRKMKLNLYPSPQLRK